MLQHTSCFCLCQCTFWASACSCFSIHTDVLQPHSTNAFYQKWTIIYSYFTNRTLLLWSPIEIYTQGTDIICNHTVHQFTGCRMEHLHYHEHCFQHTHQCTGSSLFHSNFHSGRSHLEDSMLPAKLTLASALLLL